jgi:L-ascorbate metabolism protein UlaG (beta-lactamase superfamily)
VIILKIEWVNHSCLSIHLAGKVITFDPYNVPEDQEKVDIICISHSHGDHYDTKSVQIVKKKDSKVVCPASCEDIIKNEGAIGLKPFESVEIDGITIQGVPAYNPNKRFHPKKNEWLGFIVDDGTTRIYHAGDTDVIPEMKNYKNIDYALLPVGGNQYTMDFVEGIEAAKVIKPKFVIPMHTWDKELREFKTMMKEKAPGIGVIVLNIKQPVEL